MCSNFLQCTYTALVIIKGYFKLQKFPAQSLALTGSSGLGLLSQLLPDLGTAINTTEAVVVWATASSLPPSHLASMWRSVHWITGTLQPLLVLTGSSSSAEKWLIWWPSWRELLGKHGPAPLLFWKSLLVCSCPAVRSLPNFHLDQGRGDFSGAGKCQVQGWDR